MCGSEGVLCRLLHVLRRCQGRRGLTRAAWQPALAIQGCTKAVLVPSLTEGALQVLGAFCRCAYSQVHIARGVTHNACVLGSIFMGCSLGLTRSCIFCPAWAIFSLAYTAPTPMAPLIFSAPAGTCSAVRQSPAKHCKGVLQHPGSINVQSWMQAWHVSCWRASRAHSSDLSVPHCGVNAHSM